MIQDLLKPYIFEAGGLNCDNVLQIIILTKQLQYKQVQLQLVI